MISAQLEVLLNKAIRRANNLKHEFLTIENVLLALLTDENIRKLIKDCDGQIVQLEEDLEKFVADPANHSILTQEDIDTFVKLK